MLKKAFPGIPPQSLGTAYRADTCRARSRGSSTRAWPPGNSLCPHLQAAHSLHYTGAKSGPGDPSQQLPWRGQKGRCWLGSAARGRGAPDEMRSPRVGRSRRRLAGPSRRESGASMASMEVRVGCSDDVVAAKS